jgi:circadian clock protein KaiB
VASSFFLERKSGEKPWEGGWVLILFVAGISPNSQLAIQNLKEIVSQHLPDRTTVRVVDILEDPQLAADENVLVVPTLLRLSPLPEVRITGSLGNRQKVLDALGLAEA